jgi:hypothetical protein
VIEKGIPEIPGNSRTFFLTTRTVNYASDERISEPGEEGSLRRFEP